MRGYTLFPVLSKSLINALVPEDDSQDLSRYSFHLIVIIRAARFIVWADRWFTFRRWLRVEELRSVVGSSILILSSFSFFPWPFLLVFVFPLYGNNFNFGIISAQNIVAIKSYSIIALLLTTTSIVGQEGFASSGSFITCLGRLGWSGSSCFALFRLLLSCCRNGILVLWLLNYLTWRRWDKEGGFSLYHCWVEIEFIWFFWLTAFCR